MFLRDVRKVNSGCRLRPLYVVSDFSFPLIYSTLIAYNKETLAVYLKFCFGVLNRSKTEKEIRTDIEVRDRMKLNLHKPTARLHPLLDGLASGVAAQRHNSVFIQCTEFNIV